MLTLPYDGLTGGRVKKVAVLLKKYFLRLLIIKKLAVNNVNNQVLEGSYTDKVHYMYTRKMVPIMGRASS